MADTLALDARSTAVIAMDFQNDILGAIPAELRDPALANAIAMLGKARAAGVPVIHVVVRFRDGYPEVSARNKRFSGVKGAGRLREGTPGAEIDARMAPAAGEPVVTKRRVGAFSTTDLDPLLRAKNVTRLVLFGVFTSGVVLSTVRWASDMDYELIVVGDACADPDAEVHRVLVDKVFPSQADVVGTQAFGAAA